MKKSANLAKKTPEFLPLIFFDRKRHKQFLTIKFAAEFSQKMAELFDVKILPNLTRELKNIFIKECKKGVNYKSYNLITWIFSFPGILFRMQ
jgi:hypothetical protein